MRITLAVLLALAVGVIGFFVGQGVRSGPDVDAVAAGLEDRIRRVARLATAEGAYARNFRYADEGATSWFPGTDKRVIVSARARVLVGFDLDSVRVTVDRAARELVVEGWPPPEELAFELDTDYLDVSSGVFTEVGSAELNEVKRVVRERMRGVVDYERLRAESYAAAEELLTLIDGELTDGELTDGGWSLRVVGWPNAPAPRGE